MDMVLPPDFKEFLSLLKSKNIQYLLIGGYAVGYHGYPRSTNDLDIWIAINPKTAEQMVLALKEFGFDTPQLSEEIFLKKNNIVRMGIAPMRIEILTTISGVNFEECFQQRVVDEIDGIEVNIINLNNLKTNVPKFMQAVAALREDALAQGRDPGPIRLYRFEAKRCFDGEEIPV